MPLSSTITPQAHAHIGAGFSGISVVIPYYNDEATTPRCLNAIRLSWERLDALRQRQVEAIVVDDHSPKPFPAAEQAWPFAFRVKRLSRNSGVGIARNTGAELAAFSHVLFMDSDVVLFPNYFEHAFSRLQVDSDIIVLQGPFAKEPANENPGLYQKFMALSWYQRSALQTSGNYARRFLSSGCAIFQKAFFYSIGGFVPTYKGSGGEEFEIVARIPVGGIVLDDELLCYHYYDDFITRIRKAFRRGLNYRKTIGSNAHIPVAFKIFSGLKAIFSLAMTGCLGLVLLYPWAALFSFLALALLYTLADAKLMLFTLRHGGPAMALSAIFFSQVEYSAIALAMALDFFGWNNNVQ